MADSYVIRLAEGSLPGKDYVPVEAFTMPVPANLAYAGFMGQGPKMGLKNFAPWTFEASLKGPALPVDYPNFVEFQEGSPLDTGVPDTLAASYFVVARKVAAADVIGTVGSYMGGTQDGGLGIFSSANQPWSAVVQKETTQQNLTVSGDTTTFQLLSLVVPATGGFRFTNETTGVTGVNSAGGNRILGPAAKNVLVGGLNNSALQKKAQIMVSRTYTRAVSDSERAQIVASIREYCAAMGVTV